MSLNRLPSQLALPKPDCQTYPSTVQQTTPHRYCEAAPAYLHRIENSARTVESAMRFPFGTIPIIMRNREPEASFSAHCSPRALAKLRMRESCQKHRNPFRLAVWDRWRDSTYATSVCAAPVPRRLSTVAAKLDKSQCFALNRRYRGSILQAFRGATWVPDWRSYPSPVC